MSTLAFVLLFAAAPADTVYKCRDDQGVSVYSAQPCAADPSKVHQVEVRTTHSTRPESSSLPSGDAGSGGVAIRAVGRGEVPPHLRCRGSSHLEARGVWSEAREAFEARRFDALENQLHALGTQYSCTDRPLAVALNALRDGAPHLTPLFDAWVQARPVSTHARVARGAHFVERAMSSRGGKLARDTSEQRFATMEMILARAFNDFDAAIRLDPGNGLARGERLFASRLSGSRGDLVKQYQEGRGAVPASFAFYSGAAGAFEPRWGGEPEDVMQVARDALQHAHANPDLELLPSAVRCLIANSAAYGSTPESALEVVQKVFDAGGPVDWVCYAAKGTAYRNLRRHDDHVAAFHQLQQAGGGLGSTAVRAADSLRMLGRYDEALALLDEALRYRSGDVDALCTRADVLRAKRRLEEGLRSVEAGLALDPQDAYCARVKIRLQQLASQAAGS
jgi:tetratricopeptide (TPR) repeat protein